jgi:hypothetical protein
MRNRLTKQAMGKHDSPTTMHVDYENPELSKYEQGDSESWAEGQHEDAPWKSEKREETGHASMKGASKNVYADAVKEAQELEAKALRCLKMAESFLGDDAPTDVVERQAVDFMTMSNKSVLATLRRMREFEENISEARVAKVVDAVLEVIAEEEEEKKEAEDKEEEKKASFEEDEDAKIAAIVEATLEVIAEEEKEEEEKKEAEEHKEEKKEASSEDELVSKITAAVLSALGKTSGEEKEEKEAEMKEEKEAEMKEEKEAEMKEEKEAEMKEEKEAEMKEEKEAEMKEEKEAEMKEEKEDMKEASEEITFEDGYDVTASDEDAALLSQLFTTKDASESFSEKETKIKTLKNVTASTSESGNEIDSLASLWNKDY